MESIVTGGRYRRTAAPRDHVWVTSVNEGIGSMAYRTRQGLVTAPVDWFLRQFTYDPKKTKGKKS